MSAKKKDDGTDTKEVTVKSGKLPRRRSVQPPPGDTNVIDPRTMTPVKKKDIPVICARIRFYREREGMEQKELGKRIGVIGNAVCNWENGHSRPDLSLLPKICDALNITFYELYDLPLPIDKYSKREQELVRNYRTLTDGHKYAVDGLVEKLKEAQNAETEREITKITFFTKQLAAGFDPGLEFDDKGEPLYLYSSPEIDKADCVFPVSGNSMEPDFHDGDMVLVQRFPNCPEMQPGDIGAFIMGNETYIKEYQKDGLHSLNKRYKTMKFDEETSVYLIGKVIGTLTEDDIASDEDIEKYCSIRES